MSKIDSSKNLKVKICNKKSCKCLVCFSSNNVSDNKFEFENLCKSKRVTKYFNKIIFLRDLKCRFYINGVDEKINSVDKIILLLKELTRGLETTIVGVSAGGYMSLLVGTLLDDTVRIINVGGIINVLKWHGAHLDYNFCDFEEVKKATLAKKKYFDIQPYLCNFSKPIYSFYAGGSLADQFLIKTITNCNLINNNLVVFNTKKHGDYCLSYDYKYLFTYDDAKLRKIVTKCKKKYISPFHFSLLLQGPFLLTINFLLKKIISIKRRLLKKQQNLKTINLSR